MMPERTGQPEQLTDCRSSLSSFQRAEARREKAESGAELQREDRLQAAGGELARIKDEADGNLDAAQTALTEAREELRKTGRERLLDQTVEPQRKTDAEPLAKLDQCSRAVVQTGEAVRQLVEDLVRWRAAQTRRRQALIFAGIVVIVAVGFSVYWGYRQFSLGWHYHQAQAALEAGEWEQARTEANAVLELNEGQEGAQEIVLETYYRAAVNALEGEEWDKARAELSTLQEISPSYRDTYTLMHESHYRPAKAALDAGEWEQSRANLAALREMDPYYEDADIMLRESYYRPAKVAFDAGEWEQARAELEPLLKLDEEYEDAPTLLSESYYRPAKAALEASEWEKARAELEPLLKLAPDYRGVTQLMAVYLELTMVHLPAGEFEMGSNDGDWDERPVHTVALDDFWLDRREVTNAQHGRCVDAGVCSKSTYADDSDYNGDSQPVVGVDWNDAQTYCQWAGGRLPTEAEWEYAARGPEGLVYPWGNEWDAMKLNAEGTADGYEYTAPVGSYPDGASWCGASDMAGNVWEWVADWYGDYPSGRQANPAGPDSGDYRVLHGGSWFNSSNNARCADRGRNSPGGRHDNCGFRCARNS